MELITTESYENIIDVAKKLETDRNNADYLDRGAAYYEAGMKEVLRKTAEAIYFGVDNRPSSKEAIRESYKVEMLHNKLSEILPEEHHGLLMDLNDACGDWVTIHGTDEFINGFMAAFQFFKRK